MLGIAVVLGDTVALHPQFLAHSAIVPADDWDTVLEIVAGPQAVGNTDEGWFGGSQRRARPQEYAE